MRIAIDSRAIVRGGVVGVLLATLAAPGAASAGAVDPAEITAAEDLVRRVYYEGLPYAAVRAVGPAGAARWLEMLADPVEQAHAATLAEAIGIAAPPGAYEALAAAHAAGASGEIDHAEYRLRRAIPFAMGHLARTDDRALAWLIAAAESEPRDPGWSFRGRGGVRQGEEQHLRAVTGLGLSGRPAAAAVLRQLADLAGPAAAADPGGVPGHAADALSLNDRIATRGADAVLAAPSGRRR